MTYQPTRTYPKPKPKRRVWPYIVVTAALLFCVAGVIFAVIATTTPDTVADTPATAPAKSPTKPTGKGPTPPATIDGDDIVHVGEDVPPGTYRVAEPVDGSCYWSKSKDAEGDQIIDNDIPAGGRPQVTLKKGQWFASRGCPDWAAK